MKMLHLAIGLAMAAGLSGCETAFSGPMSGQTTFVTDGASGAAGTVTAPESCVDPAPVVSTARNIGNTAAFSDAAPSDNGC
jgi:hypothetical protein